MSTTIAMFGDSYVKRLKEYCSSDLRVPGSVYWFDKGGLRADFKKRDGQQIDTHGQAIYQRMLRLHPEVVFINVSGNDVTSQTKPTVIVDRVVSLADELRENGTKTVFVAEIMTRGDFSKSPDLQLDKATFDRKRQKINTLLAKHFRECLIRFPDIKFPKDYDSDAVHLSMNSGLKKYESRIRRVLCSLRN